ncbi:Acetylornithine deacetylase/Succinyl-diaminopimelate desuccinylase [Flexibacter flexilis DSM 6793]|uniref:Acetylornithine deacetylase/Succinyl-diaminopimelate desuccinylase n=1 Tax=Flexibacter flexilis DSM 6793 TaxID=927664 RepID=A0A1I1E1Q8_9BACT|nr:M20/M25/M40 family metallo-hydrolase [Flexibacter flexilis]SFB79148.1 Acetylornithine deacetylase/Succinyl-diaminopimelate desuccinylase [Flexibacter flexilis DSM 6793]
MFLLSGLTLQGKATPTDSLALWLSQYISLASESGHEKPAGRFLADLCQKQNLHLRIFTDLDSSFNFAASLYPLSAGKPNLVLLSHIDVVPASDSNEWTLPPYAGQITDTAVWGRGALDAKGMAIMQLGAMLELRHKYPNTEFPYNITLLAVSGEETGGFNGAKIIVNEFLKELNAVAVYGEGGSGVDNVVPSKPEKHVFGISVAEKNNLWLKLELKFVTFGHGASPPRSYANKAMVKALTKLNNIDTRIDFNKTNKRMFRELGKLEGGFKGFLIKHINWWVMRPVLNKIMENEPVFRSVLSNTSTLTNMYNPPGPPNQISNKATAYLDCRLLPGANRKKFIRDIKYGLIEPRFKISVINESPEAEESSPETPYYEALDKAIQEVFPQAAVMPILFPASSDNNYFREKGVLVYGITPIFMTREQLQTIHNPDERISLQQLRDGKNVYLRFLENISLKKIK